VTKKKAEGEMNTARMKPAQKVARREEAFPLSAIAAQSSGGSGLDYELEGRGFNVDLRLRQRFHGTDRP
jgi:hypothetical protein